ncbi:MAG TPA: hypothetical protein VI485_12880 [Vicinamibacterales bacterium]|nr:hypothetical protein [Vicinamibacterales bacterium]
MKHTVSLSIGISVLAITSAASAQSMSGDARAVAMGGAGRSANIALSLVDPATPSTSIPLPIGLIQLLGNTKGFDPTSSSRSRWRCRSGSSTSDKEPPSLVGSLST